MYALTKNSKNMRKNYWIIAIISAVVLASCASTKQQKVQIELSVDSQIAFKKSADLFASEYYVSHIAEQDILLTPEECPTIHFDPKESRVAGYNGCNHYFCNYKLNSNIGITFSQPGATMMACPNMDLETAFMQALASVRTYEATMDGLLLKNEDDDVVLTLVRKVTEQPAIK